MSVTGGREIGAARKRVEDPRLVQGAGKYVDDLRLPGTGVGESGCVGAPPAIVNAVLDALAPLGITHLDMPLTSEKLWHAIRDARQN